MQDMYYVFALTFKIMKRDKQMNQVSCQFVVIKQINTEKLQVLQNI